MTGFRQYPNYAGKLCLRKEPQAVPRVGMDQIREAFPKRKVVEADGGFEVALPNGRTIRVEPDAMIVVNPETVRRDYGRDPHPGEQAVGRYARIDCGGLIQLAKLDGDRAALDHEVFHAAADLALSPGEKAMLRWRFGSEEKAAEAYSIWRVGQERTPMFGRIQQNFRRLWARLTRDHRALFCEIAEGEVFERPLGIPVVEGLGAAERAVAGFARRGLKRDAEGMAARYQERFGNHISSDQAAELFPVYSAGNWTRTMFRRAVHGAAQWIAEEVYRRALAETPQGSKTVLFTGGGTGSGKTTAIGDVRLRADEIVYDTTLNNYRSAVRHVDAALASGRRVDVQYVWSDPVEAFGRVLVRAREHGRAVPIDYHLMTHVEGQRTIRMLEDHYRGDPRVQIRVSDNSGWYAKRIQIEDLPRIDYTGVRERLHEVLERERAAGRISGLVYRNTQHRRAVDATIAGQPPARGGPPRGAGGPEPTERFSTRASSAGGPRLRAIHAELIAEAAAEARTRAAREHLNRTMDDVVRRPKFCSISRP